MDNSNNTDTSNNNSFTPQRRIFQQDVTPSAIKPRHLVVSPLAKGDLYYSNGTDFVNLPVGAANTVLTSLNGVPSWQPGGGGSGIANSLATTGSPVNVSLALPPTTGQVLTATSATTSNWQTPASPSGGSAALFTQTSVVTVANTLTETSLIGTGSGSITLPANFFTVGKAIRITMTGVLSAEITNSSSLDIEIKLGGVPVAFTGFQNIIDSSGGIWTLEAIITCWTTGATGTVLGSGASIYKADETLTDLITEAVIYGLLDNAPTPTTIDTTSALALEITATWDTANANNSISSFTFVLEDFASAGGGGGGDTGWVKITKTYTDFSIADVDSTIDLVTLPANYIVNSIKAWLNTAFDDGAGGFAYISKFGVTGIDDFFHNSGTLAANNPGAKLGVTGELFVFGSGTDHPTGTVFMSQPSPGVYDAWQALGGTTGANTGGRIFSLTDPTTITVTLHGDVNFDTMVEGSITFFINMIALPA